MLRQLSQPESRLANQHRLVYWLRNSSISAELASIDIPLPNHGKRHGRVCLLQIPAQGTACMFTRPTPPCSYLTRPLRPTFPFFHQYLLPLAKATSLGTKPETSSLYQCSTRMTNFLTKRQKENYFGAALVGNINHQKL